ncbi:hypothetical protein ZHAS_00011296 [Anopheles sinensis]|uniref:Uncharacterized protein n=1 Tax=Anopheles sinensis TaxID=74873 RepID=A0A084VZU7_ANOSI|nr:hypothetical protein ZHAS_00011296 [Anopheles sinensis]
MQRRHQQSPHHSSSQQHGPMVAYQRDSSHPEHRDRRDEFHFRERPELERTILVERIERDREHERERERERDREHRERERRELEYREQREREHHRDRDRERIERHQEMDERRRKQQYDSFLPERRDRTIGIVGGTSASDGSLTAANLIDAIITHQISQTTVEPPPLPSSRDLHRAYFPQRDHRSVMTQQTISENNGSKSQSPNVINIDLDSESSLHQHHHHSRRDGGLGGGGGTVKNITLGELTESIITKDYSPNPSPYLPLRPPMMPYNATGTVAGAEAILMADQWKNRRPIAVTTPGKEDQIQRHESPKGPGRLTPEDRHIIRLAQSPGPRSKFHEPVSPDAPPFFHPGTPLGRIGGGVGIGASASNPVSGAGGGGGGGGRDNFALDFYVKNRIVEAMRTEDEKRPPDAPAVVVVVDGQSQGNRSERQQQASPRSFQNHSPHHHHQLGPSIGNHHGGKEVGNSDRSGAPASSSERSSGVSDAQQSGAVEEVASSSSTAITSSATVPVTSSTTNPLVTSVVHNAYHQQSLSSFTTHPTYAYPFSALTVASGSTSSSPSGHHHSSSVPSNIGATLGTGGSTGSSSSAVGGLKGSVNTMLLAVGSGAPGSSGNIVVTSNNSVGGSATGGGVLGDDRHNATATEPKPLLSAQYEALSDED